MATATTTTPAKAATPAIQYGSSVALTSGQLNDYLQEYARLTNTTVAEARKLIKYGRPVSTAGQNTSNQQSQNPVTNYYLPVMPKEQVKAPTTTTPTVTPTTPTTPTAATETPHQKALRLAREGGTNYFNSAYTDLHLDPKDPYGLGTRFSALLAEALGKVPAKDDNVSTYVNYSDLFNKAKTAETTEQQNLLRSGYNTATPYGWENNYFKDTSDDDFLKSLLTGQYNTTKTTLDNKLAQGQLSQAAYDDAIKQLGYSDTGAYTGASATAWNTLQGLGGGVLSGYRTGLKDVVDDFNDAIGGYQLGQSINPANLTSNINSYVSSHGGTTMEGAIRNALGNTQLYDLNTTVTNANTNTPQTNNPLPQTNTPTTTPTTGGTSNSPLGTTASSPFGQYTPGAGANGTVSAEEEARRRTQGTTGTF